MSIFDGFPLMNAYSVNLDWIIKKIREVEEFVRNYAAVNNVAYAGVWDITKQYPQWALVTDGDTSWLAKKPVPVGIPLENAEYWQKLADLDPRIAGIIVRLDAVEKQIRGIPDYTSAKKAGFTTETPDVDLLNSLFTENSTVYIAAGIYKISKPIQLPGRCKVICDGILDGAGVVITGNEVNCYFRELRGTSGDGLLINSVKGNADAVGNVIATVDLISGFDNGVRLFSNNYSGIQNCEINLNRIDNVNNGILLECGDTGKNWINQNTFTSFWVSSLRNGATGIKFKKGAEQVDKFNGNSFTEFSCENCKTIANVSFAWNNLFENFRFLENTGADSIVCSADTESNEFRALSGYTSVTDINDKGRNRYFIDVNLNGINVSSDFESRDGTFIPHDALQQKAVDSNVTLSPFDRISVVNGGIDDLRVNLPLLYSYDYIDSPPIIVNMGGAGVTSIWTANGTLLFTNGGSWANSTCGFLPDLNGKYLLYKVGTNNYRAVKFDG